MSDDEKNKDVESDYEYARDYYYDLSKSGKEAIELMMDLARETDSPRAFEVLSTLMKQSSEITEKLMDLQKKKKDVSAPTQRAVGLPAPESGTTQQNIFVGSTKELQKFLHNQGEEKVIAPTTDDSADDSG
jgi:hypothetical protein